MQNAVFQGQTFVLLILGGLVVGFFFDVYSAFRNIFRLRRGMLSNVGDLAYWVITTVLIYGLLFITSGGEVRLFMFMAIAVGTWIYEKYLRVWFFTFIRTVVHRVCRFFNFLRRFGSAGMYRHL